MTNIRMRGTILAVLLGTSLFSYAQEKQDTTDLGAVVVTGTRFVTPIEKSGKVIYKLTADDIRKTPGATVADLLNQLPGINIDGAFGTPGTNLDYNLRGGRNRHTLILVDGLPINDPSSIANDYDLRLLNSASVEYIEVLKGGASTLYGTGAAAGVINIKLKEGTSSKPEVTLTQTIGSFETGNTNLDLNGRSDKLSYLAGAAFSTSEGFSAAEDTDPTQTFGDDGFERYSGRTKLTYDLSENFKLGTNLSYDRVRSDYDGGAFFDADNRFSITQVSYGLHPQYNYEGGRAQLKLNFNRVKREFISAFPSSALGKNFQADLTNEFFFNDKVKAIAGIQYQQFQFQNGAEEPDATNFDPYVNLSADLTEAFTLNAGVRLNNHSEYGNNFVYSLNPSYLFELGQNDKLKLFGSYSTAFVAPSLFQLFASGFGNANLEAEETQSIEFGASLYLGEDLTLNVEYFDRTEENAIDFVSVFDNMGNFIGGGYQNITGEREINGIETDLDWNVTEALNLQVHYASYQFGDETQFYRIPDLKYGLNVGYSFTQNTNLRLKYTHFGERNAAIFSAPFIVALDSYNLVDISLSHALNDGRVVLSGAVNNLFDEDFVGVYGFATRPANVTFGVSLKL
ncbi:TonB-dependent receptor plug domain-containing protein [Roseivirga sp.]|uniref:TonB-dependent receptor plug domain-containing protein n=1 Tax=Roseivirga sp. TaxID=1964215 RepID=UPI003B8DD9B2